MSVPRLARLRPGPGERDVTTSIDRPRTLRRGARLTSSAGKQSQANETAEVPLLPAHGAGAGARRGGGAHGSHVGGAVAHRTQAAPGAGEHAGTRGTRRHFPPPPSGARDRRGRPPSVGTRGSRRAGPRKGGSRLGDGSRAPGRVQERAQDSRRAPRAARRPTPPLTHSHRRAARRHLSGGTKRQGRPKECPCPSAGLIHRSQRPPRKRGSAT